MGYGEGGGVEGEQNEGEEVTKLQKGGTRTSLSSPAPHQNEAGRPLREPHPTALLCL